MTRRRFLTFAGLLAVPFLRRAECASVQKPSLEGERTVFIRTTAARQVIEHFGASDCWSIDPIGKAWSKASKERLAELLFSQEKGIGLSLWRFNIGAGDPNPDGYWNPWRRVESLQSAPGSKIDGSKQSGQQWFLKAAKKHGVEKTLAFVNSPPVWLTKNGRAFAEKGSSATNLKTGSEQAFGKYLVDVLRYFEKQGLPFDYLSPANEPNWNWDGGQEGCSYNIGELRRMMLTVAEELRAAQSKTALRIGEIGHYGALLDDPDYRDYLGVTQETVTFGGSGKGGTDEARYGYLHGILSDTALRASTDSCVLAHSYWSDGSPHDLAELRTQIRKNIDRYIPGAKFWQSEYCIMEHKRDLGMAMALRVAAVIHHDLADAEATSWSWWTAVSQGDYKDGLIYTDYGQNNSEQNILPAKTLWALGNWSRFVRPGAQRVDCQTDALPDELLITSFLSANRRDLIVTVVNPGTVAVPLRLLADRSVRTMTPYITDATRDLQREKSVDVSAPVTIPPQAVVTLIGRLGDAITTTLPASLTTTIQREHRNAKEVYAVQCGLSESEVITTARRNSRPDMPYGRDPGTGFFWGYQSYGKTGGHQGKPPAEGLPPDSVRVEEGDTPGQGITYRFAVEPSKQYSIELAFTDIWNNPDRKMDVLVQGKIVEQGLIAHAKPVSRTYAADSSSSGEIQVQVVRSADNTAPGSDPLISRIRILES